MKQAETSRAASLLAARAGKALAAVCALLLSARANAAAARPVTIALGDSTVVLNGPWRFHTGDDPRWAQPGFDDSDWEDLDLTAPEGAHDSDVGLTGYVPGWQAKGHRGYFGYAWYRIRVAFTRRQRESLALCGPFYVDSAYQVFLGGRLLGGAGDFSGPTPVAYSNQLPKFFPFEGASASSTNDSDVIAIRVWMGPWELGDPDTGGIHIAPVIGTTEGAQSLLTRQWIEMIRGYIVDAVEALLFLLLAVMVCCLIPLDRGNRSYAWLIAALVLVALRRANQPLFYWWQFETVQEFELLVSVLLIPLCLGTWTLCWRTWFQLRDRAWMPAVIASLTLSLIVLEFLRGSWFYGVFPHWFNTLIYYGAVWVRWSFVFFTVLITVQGMRRKGMSEWLALSAILVVSVGLFANEVSMLHVPGIWFPFGTGVSRTQYAYAVFDVVLLLLLLQRAYRRSSAGENTNTSVNQSLLSEPFEKALVKANQ